MIILFRSGQKTHHCFQSFQKIARRFLAVPATSAPIERVFSQGGKILRPAQCRLLQKNFENF